MYISLYYRVKLDPLLRCDLSEDPIKYLLYYIVSVLWLMGMLPVFIPVWFICGSLLRLSRVRLLVTPRTVAYQAPLSMGFSRQEYWSRLPFPSPGDLPHPGIKPRSPALQADALLSEPPGSSDEQD